MHATLRSLDSPDLAGDSLDSFVPPIPDDFRIMVGALIGPADGDGEEVFYVTVCSPKWLARAALNENTKGYEFVRHHLVVARWDADVLRRAIGDLCSHTTGADWSEIANKLSRSLAWEFEDYVDR